MNNKFFSVNKIDNYHKKVFNNRLLIAIFIAIYWWFLFFISMISNETTSVEYWITLDIKYKGIFAYFFILFLIPFVYGTTYELNKLFFGANMKKSFCLLFFGMIVFLLLPNFAYITKYYYFSSYQLEPIQDLVNPHNEIIDIITSILALFSINILISFIILLAIIIYLIKTKGMNNFSNIFLFILLSLIIAFGFLSIGFITLLKSWLALFFILSIVSFTDMFGYISGTLFGKKKISKFISPKKTLEGFLIGLVLTILCSLLITYFFTFDNQKNNILENLIHVNTIYKNTYSKWFYMLFLIISISLISSLGDLSFSYVKRNYRIKDYGSFFKEHGGFLDRFDSILFAATFYSLLIFFLSGVTDTTLFK